MEHLGMFWAGAASTSRTEVLQMCPTSRCVALISHEWPVSCQNVRGTCTRWNLRTSCCAAMKSLWLIFAFRSSGGSVSACRNVSHVTTIPAD